MKARRLITALAMGVVGATSALAASSGEGTMWTELASARHETPSTTSPALAGTNAGGAQEGGIYTQLAAQQQEFKGQLARGMAGRSGAEAELASGYRSGELPQFPEESIYDRIIRQQHQ